MADQPDKLTFEASAYLQTLIGRDLFRSQDLAIVELVKNSYDSGARSVRIVISLPSEKRPGSIEITDDGSGMDLSKLQQLFMVAGYSETGQGSTGGNRIPTGEKGIGRFASDRLGSRLTVETKTAGSREGIVVEIDWTLFNARKKRFNEISVPFYRRTLQFLNKGQSGTRLTITQIREEWASSTVESLRSTLSQLLNPFEKPSNFIINLDVTGSTTLSGPIVSTPIESADFDLRFKVKRGGTIERELRKTPSKSINPRLEPTVDPAATILKGLHGRIYYFLKRPAKDQVHGHSPGVFLYRDGFRIEPFGSSAADWLGIGEKRAKRAGHAHIVPSRLFGFVSISRRKHGGLKDTTSREALLDTAEARALVHLLKKGIIDFLEEQIRTGIAMPRWEESRARKATELQKARFQALNVMSSGVAHELRQPLQAIRMEAGNIATRLRQLAIDDPIIRAAARCIDTSIERIDQRIQLISALTGGKLDANERVDMALIVQEECTLLERRIQENNIDLTLEVPKDQDANVSDPLVRMVVKNMVENAVNALAEVKDGRQRRVAVGLSKKGFKHLLKVKDNAMGIPAEIQPRIFARFATDTTGGMGVGLYVCQLLLKSHGGEISFQTKDRVGSEFTATFVDEEGSID